MSKLRAVPSTIRPVEATQDDISNAVCRCAVPQHPLSSAVHSPHTTHRIPDRAVHYPKRRVLNAPNLLHRSVGKLCHEQRAHVRDVILDAFVAVRPGAWYARKETLFLERSNVGNVVLVFCWTRFKLLCGN